MRAIIGLFLLIAGVVSAIIPGSAVMQLVGKHVEINWQKFIPVASWLLLSVVVAVYGLSLMTGSRKKSE